MQAPDPKQQEAAGDATTMAQEGTAMTPASVAAVVQGSKPQQEKASEDALTLAQDSTELTPAAVAAVPSSGKKTAAQVASQRSARPQSVRALRHNVDCQQRAGAVV